MSAVNSQPKQEIKSTQNTITQKENTKKHKKHTKHTNKQTAVARTGRRIDHTSSDEGL